MRTLNIKGSADEPVIPFTINADFGFISVPLEQWTVEVPQMGTSEMTSVDFILPLEVILSSSEALSQDVIADPVQTMSIAVYQRGTFCDILHIRYGQHAHSGPNDG